MIFLDLLRRLEISVNNSFGFDTMQVFHTSCTLQSPAHDMGSCVDGCWLHSFCPVKYYNIKQQSNYFKIYLLQESLIAWLILKELRYVLVHLEKFSLTVSSLLFEICVNLLHHYFFLYALLSL